MRKRKNLYFICLLSPFMILASTLPVDSYIRKVYTVEEIVDACTNVLFGTITEVNPNQLTAKLVVDENLKGVSEFRQIQIRLDLGQGKHPQKLIKVLETGQPVIVFYLLEGNSIKSLAHANGTWFQLMAQDKRDKSKVWWGFTHIEIFLNGSKISKRASTLEFQKELRTLLSGNKIKLLFLKTTASESEYKYVSTLKLLEKHYITYQEVRMDDKMHSIDANILWVGYHALAEESVLFSTNRPLIKDFVKDGGVVIFSGQPDKKIDRLRKLFDLQQPPYTPESMGRKVNIHPTSKSGKLFEQPNRIHSHPFMIKATWSLADDRCEPLATTDDGSKSIVMARLKHKKGIYLITNLYNQTPSDVSKNQPLLENLIHFACNSVLEPSGNKEK